MAAIPTNQSTGNWPISKFYFQVRWGSLTFSVQEVSGLDVETEPIEYRHGDSKSFSPLKMPGLKKVGNATFRKAVFTRDATFWNWFNQIKMNTIKRIPITISLLDESGSPTMVWTLTNAFPTKITGTDLKSDGNEVAVETIEIAHEGLTIANG